MDFSYPTLKYWFFQNHFLIAMNLHTYHDLLRTRICFWRVSVGPDWPAEATCGSCILPDHAPNRKQPEDIGHCGHYWTPENGDSVLLMRFTICVSGTSWWRLNVIFFIKFYLKFNNGDIMTDPMTVYRVYIFLNLKVTVEQKVWFVTISCRVDHRCLLKYHHNLAYNILNRMESRS